MRENSHKGHGVKMEIEFDLEEEEGHYNMINVDRLLPRKLEPRQKGKNRDGSITVEFAIAAPAVHSHQNVSNGFQKTGKARDETS